MYSDFKFTKLVNPTGGFIFAGKWKKNGETYGMKGDGPTIADAALDWLTKFETNPELGKMEHVPRDVLEAQLNAAREAFMEKENRA